MVKAFEQVFGQVGNGSKVVGFTGPDRKIEVTMREGKTARDKAKGHIAGKKNRRVWDDKGCKWVKV